MTVMALWLTIPLERGTSDRLNKRTTGTVGRREVQGVTKIAVCKYMQKVKSALQR